jgi:hypothetical protein
MDLRTLSQKPYWTLNKFASRVMLIENLRATRQPGQDLSLPLLLRQYYPLDTTDPRGKVYGVLGLVSNDQGDTRVLPDYTISMKETFQKATLHIMNSTKSLIILIEDFKEPEGTYLFEVSFVDFEPFCLDYWVILPTPTSQRLA